jgi:hypothetical protein
MANTYSSLFYHVVFSTKQRTKFIRPEIEQRVWAYLGVWHPGREQRRYRLGVWRITFTCC